MCSIKDYEIKTVSITIKSFDWQIDLPAYVDLGALAK